MIDNKMKIFLNQLAQGLISKNTGENWFTKLAPKLQLEVLRELIIYTLQAGATENDIDNAINMSKLKHTYTPCVLLKNGRLNIQLSKLVKLPAAEYLKSFSILISLFSIADSRRFNNQCKNGCSHWWHQNKIS